MQNGEKGDAKRHANFASIFGTIFGGLFMDFGVIVHGFWEIKRTGNRSTNPGNF